MENTRMNRQPGTKPNGKKRTALIVVIIAAVLLIAAACVWFFWLKGYLAASNASPVYVASVASITGTGADTDPRYSGLVEPQQITKVEKDENRTVADVMVAEGDEVQVGTPLFRYDTDEMQLSIRQAELELEGIANQIATYKEQKKELEAEKAKASKDEQYSYTVSIQSVEFSIKQQEIERSKKQTEIEKLKSSEENNQVFSEVEGVIQQINLTPKTDANGQNLPFMSILSSGEFRIKGTVTEQNINSIYEGQPVTIRSRVDSDTVWNGTIDSINYEPAQNNQNNIYYGGDQGEQSSKYNFYVVLSELEGLILGQHVYIEPTLGTGTQERTGLWLPAMYITTDKEPSEEGDASGIVGYVWARDENEKLEKRQVLLGQYDSGEDLYEVVSGLETKDYIAMPNDTLVPGGPTTTDASSQAGTDGMMDDELNSGFAGDGELFMPEADGADPAVGEDGTADGTVDEAAGNAGDDAALPAGGDSAGGEGVLDFDGNSEGTE